MRQIISGKMWNPENHTARGDTILFWIRDLQTCGNLQIRLLKHDWIVKDYFFSFSFCCKIKCNSYFFQYKT